MKRSTPTEKLDWELKMCRGRMSLLTSGYDIKCYICLWDHSFVTCCWWWHCVNDFTRSFWIIQGMDFTTDKLRSLVRKWQTLIEAYVDVKTTDNYTLRMFCIGFTKRRPNQVKRTCYAQSSQIRQVIYVNYDVMIFLFILSLNWSLACLFLF